MKYNSVYGRLRYSRCGRHYYVTAVVNFYHRLSVCISLQAYLGERYCITVPPCPDIVWGNGVPPRSSTTTPLAVSDESEHL